MEEENKRNYPCYGAAQDIGLQKRNRQSDSNKGLPRSFWLMRI